MSRIRVTKSPVALGCAGLTMALVAGCGGGGDSGGGSSTAAATPRTCDTATLSAISLQDAAIETATTIDAGSYTPPGSRRSLDDLPAFCRITAKATPSSDSLINFEVWVPVGDAWNGKLVATGNGGYSPALSYGDMAYAMRQGYAAVGGDTGHQSTDPNEMFWGVGHPEKIYDWGTRSVHAITVPSKSIVDELTGKAPSRSYYYGCSTGGHQGYAEIQNYPTDFDGVIAGAPGNNRVRLNVEFMWRFMAVRNPNDDVTKVITPAKAQLVTDAAIAACDALDGVTDGIMEDPRACTVDKFNVDAMLCPGADDGTCLTAPELAAVKKIYAGPTNPRTGEQIYPGYLPGSESGWPSYWGTGTEPVRADFWRLWVFEDPHWNWWTFDYDRDLTYSLAKMGPLVDQVDPDISAFKANGGKAIVYQGWQDPVVNPADTIAYYDQVKALQGSQEETDKFFRLFFAPGMGHCGGGAGTTVFGNNGTAPPTVDAQHDVLSALDQWVEQGSAPDSIIASRLTNGTVVRTHPLCPFPKQAVYSGSGSTDDAANFSCQ